MDGREWPSGSVKKSHDPAAQSNQRSSGLNDAQAIGGEDAKRSAPPDDESATGRISRTATDRSLPLSFAQQHLWRAAQTSAANIHQVTLCLELQGKLVRRALLAALDRILARHESLRTTFQNKESEAVQLIEPPDSCFALIEQNVEGRFAVGPILSKELHDPLDLSSGPIIRGRLLKCSKNQHVLLLTFHELVADDASLNVFLSEFAALYSAFAQRKSDPLPPLQLQYADYARWVRQNVTAEMLDRQRTYWQKQLAEVPARIGLPIETSRAHAQGVDRRRIAIAVPDGLVQSLRDLADRAGVSLFEVLLSGWAVLLARWSAQEQVLIGMGVSRRTMPELRPLIGAFENTVAVRVRLHDDSTVEQLLGQLHLSVCEARENSDVPLDEVHQRLSVQASARWEDSPAGLDAPKGLDLHGLVLSNVQLKRTAPRCELTLSVGEVAKSVQGTVEYASDLYSQTSIERLLAGWRSLLEAMAQEPQQPIMKLPIIDAAERKKVLVEFNDTSEECPEEQVIHDFFEKQVERTPDAVAIIDHQAHLTYAELNGKANQLARYLRGRGVGPDQRVAVCMERSAQMIAALLGVLKAGGAYVPLDPRYPPERLARMLTDASPRILITHERVQRTEWPAGCEVIHLDRNEAEIARQERTNLSHAEVGVTAEHLAYVIFTSGSTGNPKGAMNEHRGMVNRLACQHRFDALVEGEICCQRTSISFVDAVFEIFGALGFGCSLVIIPHEIIGDLQAMAALIASEHVTRVTTVPSLARAMLESKSVMRDLLGLRSWTLSGEEVRAELLIQLQRELPDCQFIIQYGASEVSSDAAIYKATKFQGERVPLGRALPNVQLYVLDSHQEPLPIGLVGEIYVGGVGVGRGYLNHPELTATRFVADPFSPHPEHRLYRTGDLGRWREEGVLEYLGRCDHQVKIRGFRIEPAEIERKLLQHSQVREAVVVAREGPDGEMRLVAYLTLNAHDHPLGSRMPCALGEHAVLTHPELAKEHDRSKARIPSARELRTHLRALLPEHMIPAALVILEQLPLTPNGKLDRGALPAPQLSAYSTKPYQPVQGPREQVVADLWCELLGTQGIGQEDQFFELGGHSLLIVTMIERLRRRGWRAEAQSLFANPTLKEFARTLREHSGNAFEVPPGRIPPDCTVITPHMLSLVELEPKYIEHIIRMVPGGGGQYPGYLSVNPAPGRYVVSSPSGPRRR